MTDFSFDSELLRVIMVLGLLILASAGLFLLSRKVAETDQPLPNANRSGREGDLPPLTFSQKRSMLYYYRAHVVSVYDGDTITVDMDLGLGISKRRQVIRLWKINAPEVRGEERPQGLKVRDYVRELILERDVLVRTILDKRGQDRTEKFGRLLGEILAEDESGNLLNINELLLKNKMATPLGEDGSTVARVTGTRSLGDLPKQIPCHYCGENRRLVVEDLSADWVVAQCPNCLDPSYSLKAKLAHMSQVQQSLDT
jgi:micrococcal nuclease